MQIKVCAPFQLNLHWPNVWVWFMFLFSSFQFFLVFVFVCLFFVFLVLVCAQCSFSAMIYANLNSMSDRASTVSRVSPSFLQTFLPEDAFFFSKVLALFLNPRAILIMIFVFLMFHLYNSLSFSFFLSPNSNSFNSNQPTNSSCNIQWWNTNHTCMEPKSERFSCRFSIRNDCIRVKILSKRSWKKCFNSSAYSRSIWNNTYWLKTTNRI